ncbi:hypothetical protein ACRAWF_43465 [Streptomyces sp. L7]
MHPTTRPSRPRTPSVPTDVLAEIGALTEELRVQSIMQNGTVTVAEAGLDDPARLALVLARPDDTLVYTSTLAALVARNTARPVQVLGPDGRADRSRSRPTAPR